MHVCRSHTPPVAVFLGLLLRACAGICIQERREPGSDAEREGSSDNSSNPDGEEQLGSRSAIQLSIVEQLCSLMEDADATKLKRVNQALVEIVHNDTSTATEYGETEVDEA